MREAPGGFVRVGPSVCIAHTHNHINQQSTSCSLLGLLDPTHTLYRWMGE